MTKRRRLLWFGAGFVLLAVVLRFAVRWADATRRLPPAGELGITVVQVLLLVALLGGLALLVRRRAQARRKR